MPVAVPIEATADQLAQVKYNSEGLVPAIVQEHRTGVVLMMAWMNAGTVEESLTTGRTVFWSRSRKERWRKGDSSGDRQWIREAYYDCDGDTLLFVVDQEGAGACHTGEHSCFFRPFGPAGAEDGHGEGAGEAAGDAGSRGAGDSPGAAQASSD